MKKYGRPLSVVTDGLCSYPAAMKEIGNADRQEAGRRRRWHLDEAFVKVNGKLCYLWRAVDHEGEVLEAVVTAKRDKAAAAPRSARRESPSFGP